MPAASLAALSSIVAVSVFSCLLLFEEVTFPLVIFHTFLCISLGTKLEV